MSTKYRIDSSISISINSNIQVSRYRDKSYRFGSWTITCNHHCIGIIATTMSFSSNTNDKYRNLTHFICFHYISYNSSYNTNAGFYQTRERIIYPWHTFSHDSSSYTHKNNDSYKNTKMFDNSSHIRHNRPVWFINYWFIFESFHWLSGDIYSSKINYGL